MKKTLIITLILSSISEPAHGMLRAMANRLTCATRAIHSKVPKIAQVGVKNTPIATHTGQKAIIKDAKPRTQRSFWKRMNASLSNTWASLKNYCAQSKQTMLTRSNTHAYGISSIISTASLGTMAAKIFYDETNVHVSVDTLNNSIDRLLAKARREKIFGQSIINAAQRNILSVDTESLKKIATQYPEAEIIFAQEFAKHIPDEAIEKYFESIYLHTAQSPKCSRQTEQSVGLLHSKVATKHHQELVQDIARTLHLDPIHVLKVRQYPEEPYWLSSMVYGINMKEHGYCMMSPIVDKAKHFIPYMYTILLGSDFAKQSPEVQKFLIGHELMHVKLGHCADNLDTQSPEEMERSRNREKECDLGSASLGSEYAAGGIDYFQNDLLKEKTQPLDTHPCHEERRKYLQDLAKKQPINLPI